MRYIDITKPIYEGMPKYPTDPDVSVKVWKSFNKGNSSNLVQISLGSHTGTHLDAPRHIFDSGRTVDNLKLYDLILDVIVTDAKTFFGNKFYRKLKVKGVLFKKIKKRTGINIEEANVLLEKGIRLVGTEDISIEDPTDKHHPVHRALLKKEIIIIEELDLSKVKHGKYKLVCLPLKIKGGDGSPVRAVLIDD